MELRHFRYFVAVAEELHFGRAAQRLHIAQPPLSQQIKALEDELGVELLLRNRRRVELTEPGKAFLEEARLTLAQAAKAERVAREARQGIRGRIEVAFVTSASYSILPGVIRAFRSAYPGVDLGLNEMIPARQLQALETGDINAGLLRPPVPNTCLSLQTILAEPLVAALPAGHRLSGERTIDLAMLAEEAFVLFPRSHGPGIYDVIMKTCHAAGFTPHVEYAPNEMQAILAYVAGGLGLSLVPGSLAGIHPAAIRYRPLAGDGTCLELALVWNGRSPSPVLDNFRAVCAAEGARYEQDLRSRLNSGQHPPLAPDPSTKSDVDPGKSLHARSALKAMRDTNRH